VTLAVLTNLTQYTYNHASLMRAHKATHWQRHGPTYLVALSVPLVCADLVRHLLQDGGQWPSPGSDMFRPNCKHGVLGFKCLTPIGWIFSVFCTYTGFTLLIVGTLWAADFVPKLQAAWKKSHRRSRQSTSISQV